ncbi:complement C1q domain-containing protein [Halomarina litorea]|uniref:complement C1q domain-containing protein n=1 Tax=Halomarina litorea TaxID=2961595 RepID=UPI0020C4F270|nr:complement C1q domain-containing protein [Halomarina sp. BCD28]
MTGNKRGTDRNAGGGEPRRGETTGGLAGLSLSRRTALGLLGVAGGLGLGSAGTAGAQMASEAFSASLGSSIDLPQSSGRVVTFDRVAFDDGGNYDAETGQYTASASGRYRIDTAGEFHIPTVRGAGVKLLVRVNSTPRAMSVAAGATDVNTTASVSKLVDLHAGESVDVFVTYSSTAPSDPAVVVGQLQPLTFLTVDRVG